MLRPNRGFTLVEMLVAITVLAIIVLFVTRLFDNAAAITSLATRRMDADGQARPVLDRMSIDFAQMVKRIDVSYYLKTAGTSMTGNDLMAFYAAIPGYYPATPSPISLVAYRINGASTSGTYNRLERMGKGLPWNGSSATDAPTVFLPLTIDAIWPSVASNSTYDSNNPNQITYEIMGPQVFRLEYYYLDKTTGGLVPYPPAWSSLSTVKISDAAAIVVAIAVIDPKSQVLLSNSQLTTLAGRLSDYSSAMGPGELLTQWQSTLDGMTDMPRQALSGVRLYERYFYLSK